MNASDSLFYIASPYSHDSAAARLFRFNKVCEAVGALTLAGFHCYSPIAHFHPIAMISQLPTDWNFWEEKCKVMVRACTHFVILELQGWSTSTGIKAERKYAAMLGKPLLTLDPYIQPTTPLATQLQLQLEKRPYGF
jgi:hypothetical protein